MRKAAPLPFTNAEGCEGEQDAKSTRSAGSTARDLGDSAVHECFVQLTNKAYLKGSLSTDHHTVRAPSAMEWIKSQVSDMLGISKMNKRELLTQFVNLGAQPGAFNRAND